MSDVRLILRPEMFLPYSVEQVESRCAIFACPEIRGEITFQWMPPVRRADDIEKTFDHRTRTIAQFCGDMERAKGPARSLLEHYLDGHRHPHDYKLPLNLWETTPD